MVRFASSFTTSLFLGLALVATAHGTAHGADQCRILDDIPPAPALKDVRTDAPVHDLRLVYSWSPAYCKAARTPNKKQQRPLQGKAGELAEWDRAFQCDANAFGFVVHGLWPQAKGVTGKNGQPRACKAAAPIGGATVRAHLCTVPGVRLMQNEWLAHGTCHWGTPEAYFDDIEKLADAYPMPTLDSLQGKDVGVDRIVDAIVVHGKGKLAPDMIGVEVRQVDGKRVLNEVYVCLDLQHRPKQCLTRGTPGKLNALVLPVVAGGAD